MTPTLLKSLLHKVGQSKVPRYAKEGFGFRGTVLRSGEFRRIEALPRRDWKEALKYKEVLTENLKTKKGVLVPWDIQVGALINIAENKGAFLPIGVGQGKSLISLLASIVLEAKSPILFVPAALREQTKLQVIPEMKKHWELDSNLKVIGYSELSLAKNKDMLEEIKPDLIIFDECHYVKNKSAGRTKRLVRYFRDHPDTMCVAMSGTISNRSLKDWAHIAEWCLGANAPIPLRWQELCEWADCLDEGVPEESRISPGALMGLCKDGENARQGFRRRLVETPGVVASEENELGVSLRIKGIKDIVIPDNVQEAIKKLKNTWETPNGDVITEAVSLWRHVRELALGFYYRWIPEASRDWLEARRNWKSYVRETLKHNRRGLDTELQVWNECKKEETLEAWKKWRDIKDTFKINTVAEWISDFALKECKAWLLERRWLGRGKGICWVEQREFGKELSKYSEVPYFGAGDSRILTTDSRAIIASISAHGEGKNLQRFSKNLITCPPTSGKTWEQVLGRTHREGQQADTVECEVLMHIEEFEKAFDKARGDARYLEDTYGNRQKLNYGDIVV
jgi:hypothetical protein